MKEQGRNDLIAALLMTVLGVLFLVLKADVVSVAMTILGVLLIVQALFDLLAKQYVICVIKAVIGVLAIVFGWWLVDVALFIFAAILLIFGILQLIVAIKALVSSNNILAKVLVFIRPALYLVISFCLLFHRGTTVTWVFIIAGIFFILQGVISLVNYFATKNGKQSR